MKTTTSLQEWRRMIKALQMEQGMERREIADALNLSPDEFRSISRGLERPQDADRITKVLRDLRRPFDDDRLAR